MANLFYRNPRLVALVFGLLFVAGFSALRVLPRQEDASIARRFATVTTFYPGASALRVESLVTEKLETKLQELHEIVELHSHSRTGASRINIDISEEFDERSVDEVWSKVRDRLNDAASEFPPGVHPPIFKDRTSKAATLIAGVIWTDEGDAPLALLSRLAEQLESELRNLPGTLETERFGEAEEEIRVTIDPLTLAAANLTTADVSRAIARADAKLPAGQLRHDTNDLVLEVAGELTTLARVREVPLARDAAGKILRVGDIAQVTRDVRAPPSTLAFLNGRPGIAVTVTMEERQRVDLWAKRARAAVARAAADAPRGVRIETIFDQSHYTEQRLRTLVGNLLLAISIVVTVLFVMMGLRSALIVATALPPTFAAVFTQFNMLGIPLHQMSVTGLIIALGLLIDNAIVVVEEYNTRARQGEAPSEAVAGTVRHLFVPLSASTLTTVLAFMPIAIQGGATGEFIGAMSVGVMLAVVNSFLISMTLVVTLAGLATREGANFPRPGEAPWWRAGLANERALALYKRTLRAVLKRPVLGIAVSGALPLAGFLAAGTLPSQFFPANDRNQFQIIVQLPPQSALEETRATVEAVRARVHAHPEVTESHWFLGESSPRVYYNMMPLQDQNASAAGGFVTTRSAEATERLLPALQRELIAAFPRARVLALPFEQGPPFEAPIEVRVLGPDLGVLRRLGDELRGVLAQTRAVTYTSAKLSGGTPKLVLATDENAARLSGLGLSDIAEQLNASLEGSTGGTLLEGTEEVPVRVRAGAEARGGLSNIVAGRVLPPGRAPVQSAQPGADARVELPGVPLGALTKLQLTPEIGSVSRRDGERTNVVQAFLMPYTLISKSLADFEARRERAKIALPPGYRIEYGGEDAESSEAVAALLSTALPLFMLMFGAVVLSFNSFRLAGVILAVAAQGVGLALFGVWLFGHPLGFTAIVGAMGLMGLAINDAIVVIAALRDEVRATHADVDGTVEVVVGATRHVLATTLTTMGGFLPLILFGGRFWPPMATAIAGGVAGASILALYFVPSVYISIRRQSLRREQARRG